MTIISPLGVFREFKRAFKTSGLSTKNWDNNKLWTKKMIGNGKTREKGDYGIFGKISKKWDFYPEEPGGWKTDYHVERGWLTSDQLWSHVPGEQIWELKAAIEHENNPSWNAVRYNVAKLADIKAKLKIFVGYPKHEERWGELLDRIRKILRKKSLKNKAEKYLVIFGWIDSREVEFKAWGFDCYGHRSELKV